MINAAPFSEIVRRQVGSRVYELTNFTALEIEFPIAEYVKATIDAQVKGPVEHLRTFSGFLGLTANYGAATHLTVSVRFNSSRVVNSVAIDIPANLTSAAYKACGLNEMDAMIWRAYFNGRNVIHTSQRFSDDVFKYIKLAEQRANEIYTVHKLLDLLLDAHDLRAEYKQANLSLKRLPMDHDKLINVDYRCYWLSYIRPEADAFSMGQQIITQQIANQVLSPATAEYIGTFLDKWAISTNNSAPSLLNKHLNMYFMYSS